MSDDYHVSRADIAWLREKGAVVMRQWPGPFKTSDVQGLLTVVEWIVVHLETGGVHPMTRDPEAPVDGSDNPLF